MYLEHFGLRRYPFALTPDTDFLVECDGFGNGLDVLEFALSAGEGITMVCGEAGIGKTLLCRKLIDSMDDSFVTLLAGNPSLTPAGLYRALAKRLRVEHPCDDDPFDVFERMAGRPMSLHAAGRKVVVVVDEAQALSDDCMEALRLLSNLESGNGKLLQFVLFGLPELDIRLRQDRLRPLRQRIAFGHTLERLSPDMLDVYVRHRLDVAGFRGAQPFGPRSMESLQLGSRGIPRLVNVLAHKAMLVAFGRGDTTIDALHVDQAISDTDGAPARRRRARPYAAIRSLFDRSSGRVRESAFGEAAG